MCVINMKSCSCLSSGTHLRFHSGFSVEWQDVEDLDSAVEDSGDEEQSKSLKVHHTSSLSQDLKGDLFARFILNSGLMDCESSPNSKQPLWSL